MEKIFDHLTEAKKFFFADKTQLNLFIAGFLILFCNLTFFVGRHAINMPFWDEWDITQEVTQENNWFTILTHQHNEHRIGVGLAVAKIAAYFTNWNQFFETKIISFQLLLSCLLILLLIKKIRGKITLLDLIIPLIFFNTFQDGNIIFSFQLTFVFPLVFLCLGLASLLIKEIPIRNLLIVFFSLLAAFSSFHGLFVPLVFIAFFVLEFIKDRRQSLKIFLPTLLAEIAVIASYFIGYKSQLQTSLTFNFGQRFFDFLATMFSNGFFFTDRNGEWFFFSYLVLIITLIFGLIGLWNFFREHEKTLSLSIIGSLLIAYALLFNLSITVGRSAFGLGQGITTRYLTFSMLAALGVFLIVSECKKTAGALKFLLLLFLLFNVWAFHLKDEKSIERGSFQRQAAAECYLVSNKNFDKCFQITPLYPSQERLEMFLPDVLKFKKGQ